MMIVALILTLAAVLGSGSPATAANCSLSLPAGQACAFPLCIEISGGNLVEKDFFDKNGNLVRTLTAGRGTALLFINLDTQATFAVQSNGSVMQTTNNPDGSQTVVLTGHNVVILFPEDVPAGPSTTQYVGRLVETISPIGVFTLQSFSGTSTDICAELSD
jgi:hypothetical protein